MKTQRLEVRIAPKLKCLVHELAQDSFCSVTDIVTEALVEILKRNGKL